MMDQAIEMDIGVANIETDLSSVLFKISDAAGASKNLADLFLAIHRILKSVVDTNNFFIGLIDEVSDSLVFPYFQDECDDGLEIKQIGQPGVSSLSIEVIRNGRPLFLKHEEIINHSIPVQGTMPCVWIGIPLRIQHKVIGLMAVQDYHDADHFTIEDYDILVSISEQVAYAIERKSTEAALHEKERKYRGIIDSIEDGYYEIDLSYHILFFNDGLCHLFGVTPTEMKRIDIRSLIQPEYLPEFIQTFQWVMQTRKSKKGIGCEIVPKGADRIFIEISVTLMTDQNAKPIGFRGVVWDVTEKKKIAGELIRTQNFLQNIFDSTVDSIITTDLRGVVTFLSTKARLSLKMTDEDLIGKKVHLIYEHGVKDASFIMSALMSKGELKNHEMRLVIKGDEFLDIHLSASLLRNEHGIVIGTLGIFRDISDKKRLEEELQQTQRLKTVATLAGGIAHNFNNLLMGIQGYVSLMLYEMEEAHPHRKMLENIERQIENGAKLTSQLIGYAKENKHAINWIDLNPVIQDVIYTFQITQKDIQLHVSLDPDLFRIRANKGQIEQVLMNLLANAMEAMPAGGDLFISTRNAGARDIAEIKSNGAKASLAAHILLTFRDTGMGMDENTLSHIFDPFFTTKSMGKGTGLGLSSVYGIINALNGVIKADSHKGRGTRVRILLPAVHNHTHDLNALAKTGTSPAALPKTILMVDDEAILLDVGRKMIETMGYQVLLAGSGREAVEIFNENHHRIDLVILDVVMPLMNGNDTYLALQAINPEIPAIFASSSDARDMTAKQSCLFIQKPYNLNRLADKISQALRIQNP